MPKNDQDAKILILIPAYNAAHYLPELVSRIKKAAPNMAILIVNDGSTDSTSDILPQLNILTITNSANQGKGFALNRGFGYAIEHGFEYVITLDADLQHLPEEIPLFINKVESADIIIGKRDISLKNMPLVRWLSNSITSIIISRFCGCKINDSQSGYRMYAVDLLKRLKLKSEKYDFESELLIQAGEQGAKFAEVPVSTIYRGSPSHINHLADTGRFIKLIWKRMI
jgi:glycosyltransferase involved in cell wall biosynthesis